MASSGFAPTTGSTSKSNGKAGITANGQDFIDIFIAPNDVILQHLLELCR